MHLLGITVDIFPFDDSLKTSKSIDDRNKYIGIPLAKALIFGLQEVELTNENIQTYIASVPDEKITIDSNKDIFMTAAGNGTLVTNPKPLKTLTIYMPHEDAYIESDFIDSETLEHITVLVQAFGTRTVIPNYAFELVGYNQNLGVDVISDSNSSNGTNNGIYIYSPLIPNTHFYRWDVIADY